MKYIYIVISLLFSLSVNATITTSIATGNWNDASVWDNGIPTCGDTIIVAASHTVTVNVQVDLSSCTPIWIQVYGTLKFKNGSKLQLPAGSGVHVYSTGSVVSSNGGGNSVYISIGGTSVWSAADPDIVSETVLDDGTGGGEFPIELVLFDAKQLQNKIELTWQTAAEENSNYYQIEKSLNLQTWEVIGELAAAGNSNLLLDYSFIDHNPQIGSNYYRLLQVDFDGKYEYFGPIHQSFTTNSEIESINIYPNPNTNGILSITIGGSAIKSVGNIEIYDYSARLIMFQKMEYNDNPTIDISQLSKGVYLLQYISNQQIISKKLIIQ